MSVNFGEQFAKMSIGEKIILIAGPLFLIAAFLPWFEYDIAGFDGPSRNGWSGDLSFFTIIATILALAMAVIVAVVNFTTVQMPALPQGVTWARIHLGLAIYIVFAVAIRLIIGESEGGFDADMTFGLWIAALLAIALLAGAFLMFQEEQKGGGAEM